MKTIYLVLIAIFSVSLSNQLIAQTKSEKSEKEKAVPVTKEVKKEVSKVIRASEANKSKNGLSTKPQDVKEIKETKTQIKPANQNATKADVKETRPVTKPTDNKEKLEKEKIREASRATGVAPTRTLTKQQVQERQVNSKKELRTSIEKGDRKVLEARQKISDAKSKLEKDKKEGKVTEAEYKERQLRITKAEKGLIDLNSKVVKAKALK